MLNNHELYLCFDYFLRFDKQADEEEKLISEGGLDISNTPKVVVAGGGSVIKSFKAETVELEIPCKVSTANAEFKPISKDNLPEKESGIPSELILTKGLNNLDLNKDDDDDSPPSERISSSLTGNKRKRRKRSILKKKSSNGAQRRNSNIDQPDTNTEPKEQTDFDPIFQIEDLDQVIFFCLKSLFIILFYILDVVWLPRKVGLQRLLQA